MSENNNAPERIWIGSFMGGLSCRWGDDKDDAHNVEYIRKDIADREKLKVANASQYNIDETIEHNYQMGLSKRLEQIEEILKPIRELKKEYGGKKFECDSAGNALISISKYMNCMEKAVEQTLEIADKEGKE